MEDSNFAAASFLVQPSVQNIHFQVASLAIGDSWFGSISEAISRGDDQVGMLGRDSDSAKTVRTRSVTRAMRKSW